MFYWNTTKKNRIYQPPETPETLCIVVTTFAAKKQ
jgi:hypothetical protein